MLSIIRERLRQKHRTIAYPASPVELPPRFLGLPILDASQCGGECTACVESCPTDAIVKSQRGLSLDLGRCLFCSECVRACPEASISFSNDYRLAVRKREDLIVRSGQPYELAAPLDRKMKRIFGRSLKLRQVCAGGDGSCEADLNVLSTVVFDIGRFGIQFVASPRHADGLVVTGPVTENMKYALLQTYEAIPAPKLVIAVGADAISGGVYRDNPEVNNGIEGLLPVDLYLPGWPPHPMTILDGLLRLLGRLENDPARLNDLPS